MAEDRVMQSLLLDFYGELLTDKQRECCELHFNEDLSLAEIAEQCGVSRQGVWDNIRRGVAALEEIEAKTGLIRRFSETQNGLDRLDGTVRALLALPLEPEGRELAEKLRQEIRALRTRG
ncbi:MAG: YlxM family DNA-binding protein [Oscillospiraceae bacterium]|nr:YlxM family DNA-binding protein [Oscillospiraceae bacterium]